MDTRGSSTRGLRRRVTSHPLIGLMLAVSLIATGCSNRADTADTTAPPATAAPTVAPSEPTGDSTPDDTTPEDTTPPVTDPPGVTFGDMASPCGPGDATIASGQNGGKTLKLATATDKGAEVAPGLDKEMYDTAVAFAEWCNEQGGIAGLPVEIVDADAKLFEVPASMEKVCAEAFAMVGGGWAFDDQQFPRFHECKMIDISGYAVTTPKAMSNGMVSPVPNRSDVKSALPWKWMKENYPESISRTGFVYSDITAAKLNADAAEEMMGQLGGFTIVDRIPTNPTGEANWAPIAQRLKEKDVKALSFVGAPETLAQLMTSMFEVGYTPDVMMLETNFYADVLIERAGKSSEGAIARTIFVPFEERDRSKALDDYMTMMETYNPDGKIATLGLQSMSAFLLFAQAANACIASNDGVLERECVLKAAGEIHEWTGGGLHAVTDPGARTPSSCTTLVQVKDGEWQRLWPELESADDSGNGFACDDDTLVTLTGDYGEVTAGVDASREN